MNKVCGALVLALVVAVPSWADSRLDDAVQKAEEEIHKGRPEKAVKELEKLAKKEPTDIGAQVALGRLLFRVGRRDEAGAAYQQATQLAGASPGAAAASAYTAFATYQLTRGSAAKALDLAKAAVKADSDAKTLAVLAQAQARTGEALLALQTADRAVAAGPNVAAAYQARALAFATLDRLDDAVAAARKAVELAPQSVSAKVSLAFMLVLQGKPAEAVPIARAAKEADVKPAEAYAVLGLAMAKANPSDWDAGIGEAQEGALYESHSPLMLYCLGQLFEMIRNWDQAIADYREATNIDPQFGPASYALVFALYHKGDTAGALVEAKRLAGLAPKNGQIQLVLGELLLRREEFDAAVAPLEQAVALLPQSSSAHYFLGLARERTGGQPADVAKLYCKASSLNPAQVDYRVECGFWLVRADQVAPGIEQLLKVTSDPGYKAPEAWIALGYAYANSEPPRYADSASAYKKALALVDPSKPEVKTQALFGLAHALDRDKRADEAIPVYEELARHDPSYAAAAATRIAWLELRRELPTKKFTKTEEALKRLASITSPDDATIAAIHNIIERKNPPPPDDNQGCEPNACIRILKGHATAEKIKAVNDLKSYGRDGAEWIGSYALFYQDDLKVRNAALDALVAMKGRACAAIREIKGVAETEVTPNLDATRPEMEREVELIKLIDRAKALRNALAGTCK